MPLPRTMRTVAVMTPAMAMMRMGTRTGMPPFSSSSWGWVSVGSDSSWEEEEGSTGGSGSLLSLLLSLEELLLEEELTALLAGGT